MSVKEAPCTNAWEEATLLMEWALTPRGHGSPCDWYAKATASTIQWANLCLETAFPFCCPPWQTKCCSELLTLRVRSTYMRNALKGHSSAKAGSSSSEGSACRFTTWLRKGVVGTLGTYPGRGRPAQTQGTLHLLKTPGGSRPVWWKWARSGKWVQRLKRAPLKSSQDDREVRRGHNGRPGGIHPPGPLQEPHNEIMLSQEPAVHCIVVSRNSGYIHFQGGGWQPTLQPFLQERKHYSNRASSGVFSARRTPGREQTPFQCVGLPCWRSSSLNDGLYHRQW